MTPVSYSRDWLYSVQINDIAHLYYLFKSGFSHMESISIMFAFFLSFFFSHWQRFLRGLKAFLHSMNFLLQAPKLNPYLRSFKDPWNNLRRAWRFWYCRQIYNSKPFVVRCQIRPILVTILYYSTYFIICFKWLVMISVYT